MMFTHICVLALLATAAAQPPAGGGKDFKRTDNNTESFANLAPVDQTLALRLRDVCFGHDNETLVARCCFLFEIADFLSGQVYGDTCSPVSVCE